jgi:hypothetical protein
MGAKMGRTCRRPIGYLDATIETGCMQGGTLSTTIVGGEEWPLGEFLFGNESQLLIFAFSVIEQNLCTRQLTHQVDPLGI